MSVEIDLIGYGIYEIHALDLRKIQDINSPKDYFYHSNVNYHLQKHTDKIPLSAGLAFGINFIIHEETELNKQQLAIRMTHPEMENPETNFSFTETIQYKVIPINTPHLEFFIFEYPWEMIPGFWTFRIESDSILLLEKEFEIYVEDLKEDLVEEKFFYDM